MAAKQRLGKVQSAILEHVRGLGPKAKATTEDLRQAVAKATGKAVGNTSLSGAIRSLRQQGLVQVRKVGRELRIGVAAGSASADRAARKLKSVSSAAISRAELVAREERARLSRVESEALAAVARHPAVGTVLAPGESLVLRVEKDAVHVLENVHGRVEHRKVSRKG